MYLIYKTIMILYVFLNLLFFLNQKVYLKYLAFKSFFCFAFLWYNWRENNGGKLAAYRNEIKKNSRSTLKF